MNKFRPVTALTRGLHRMIQLYKHVKVEMDEEIPDHCLHIAADCGSTARTYETQRTSAVILAIRSGVTLPHSTVLLKFGFFISFRFEIRLRTRFLYFMSVFLNSWKMRESRSRNSTSPRLTYELRESKHLAVDWFHTAVIYCERSHDHSLLK